MYRPMIKKILKRHTNLFKGENNNVLETNGESRFLLNNLHLCKIIFDVGANVGDWSQIALSGKKDIQLHSFEPCKKAFKELISKKFPDNVHCNNIGLSSKKQTLPIYGIEGRSSWNSLYQREELSKLGLGTIKKIEDISLITLEQYCKQNNIDHIDFLKIDVEGHEMETLNGGRLLFEQKKINIVQFEYGGCNIDSRTLLKDFFKFFEKFNYGLYKIYPQHIRLIKEYSQELENFQYQNWIAIKNNHHFVK
jgi:FkbM family methyltransferase